MPSPAFQDHAAHLHAIIGAALRAAEPRAATARAARAGARRGQTSAVVAVGKAAPAMLAGFVEGAGEPAARFMIAPEGVAAPPWSQTADHPLPSARNIEAARQLEAFVRGNAATGDPDDSLVLLLSGGASALMTLPERPLDLSHIRDVTDALLRAGASIHELNCVRKHIERLKGGKLAALGAPRPWQVYALSDVIGDDPSVIGSGPCTPDPTTFAEALAVLGRRGVNAPEVAAYLREGASGAHPETPKPGDPSLPKVRWAPVGSNRSAVSAAGDEATALGFLCRGQSPLEGEAGAEGRKIARAVAGHRAHATGPTAFLWGGETTVTVGASTGKGGRNQELALAAAIEIGTSPGIAIATFATDGVDGPTDAAGAIVTGETCTHARALGIDPVDFLRRHDSYTFFERAGGHLKSGPSGTNVNDLTIALAY